MSRILLTGSAGFIGSHLVERFLADGHEVVGVDNYLSGQRQNTELFLGHPRFGFIEADVSQGLDAPGEFDWVLHFASPASPPHYQKHAIETLMVGAQGTQHCLELARRKGAKFLLASTSEIYGDPMIHPQPETYWGNVNPIGPRSVYDEAKRYAEAVTMAYHRTHGLDTRIVRIFNTYGPRNRPNDGRVVPTFINQALRGEALTVFGEGQQTRSFQYVSDLIEGIRRLMDSSVTEPVNIGNPIEFTVKDFAKLVLEMTGSKSEIVYRPLPQDDPKTRKPDNSRAQALLGWSPQVPLEEGLRKTIDWYRRLQQGEFATV